MNDFIKCLDCDVDVEIKCIYEEIGDGESGPLGLDVDYECMCEKCESDLLLPLYE
jgi:hypothetical protein